MSCCIRNRISELPVFCYIKTHWSILQFGRVIQNPSMILKQQALVICKILVHSVMQLFQMLIHFIIQHKKESRSSKPQPIPLAKSFSVGKLSSALYSTYTFSRITIFPWNPKFYHWQQLPSVVFLDVTASLFSFLRKCQMLKCK